MKRIGLLLMAIVFVASQGISQIINVPADQPSIQAGIDSASNGDTVLVAEDTYFENINFNGKAITVASHFLVDGDTSHISKTIIDGSQPENPDTASVVRMISGEDSTSVLCGFKITGGTGMYTDASLCLTYPLSTIYINGGGVIIIDGGATIRNNIITNNSIEQREGRICGGGGIDVIISESERSNEKTLLIENNIISHNLIHAGESGGAGMRIFVDKSSSVSGMNLVVQGNTLTANRIAVPAASNKGVVGAGMLIGFRLPIRNGDYLIRNNSISNNRIESSPMPAFAEGGGIYLFYLESGDNGNCAPKIYNNIISENYTPDMAGGIGIYNWGDRSYNISPSFFNNTVINNQSPISPGLDLVRVKTLLVNNIFSNHGATSTTPEIKTNNATALLYNNAIRGSTYLAQGNINVLPIFEEDSYELTEGSAGIGAGTSSVEIAGEIFEVPETDFYSNPRPDHVDRWVDMGAIESPFERIVYIPDTAFLHALIEEGVDSNVDSLVSYAEAEAITNLEITVPDDRTKSTINFVTDVTGIEAFINLNTLILDGNEITNLDLSYNTRLTLVSANSNLLQSINVSKCLELDTLEVGRASGYHTDNENQLTELDVSNNTKLKRLVVWENQLTDLDISNNTALSYLDCDQNQLTSIDLSNNHELDILWCRDNQISSMDVTNCTELKELYCHGNQIDNLNLSNNDFIRKLNLSNMPSLNQVCVWEAFPYGVEVDTIGSPNVYFTTECTGSTDVNDDVQTGLSIYPNPTNSLLTIETNQPGSQLIELNYLNGQMIYSTKREGTTHQIDLSTFQKGVYFITISSKDNVTTRKIIKQ